MDQLHLQVEKWLMSLVSGADGLMSLVGGADGLMSLVGGADGLDLSFYTPLQTYFLRLKVQKLIKCH